MRNIYTEGLFILLLAFTLMMVTILVTYDQTIELVVEIEEIIIDIEIPMDPIIIDEPIIIEEENHAPYFVYIGADAA